MVESIVGAVGSAPPKRGNQLWNHLWEQWEDLRIDLQGTVTLESSLVPTKERESIVETFVGTEGRVVELILNQQ